MAWVILGAIVIAAVALWLYAQSRLPREQRWIGKDPGGGGPPGV